MSAAIFHNVGGRPSPGPTWRGSIALPREQHEAVEQVTQRAKPRFWKSHRLSLPKSTVLAVMAELFLVAAGRITQADVEQLPIHHQAPGAVVLEAAQARARGEVAPPVPAVELVPAPAEAAQLAFDFPTVTAPASPKEPTVNEPKEPKPAPAPLRLVSAVPKAPASPAPATAPSSTTNAAAPTARWKALRERLRVRVGANNFAIWLEALRPLPGQPGRLVLECRNSYYQGELEDRFRAVIKEEATRLAGRPVEVRFVVAHRPELAAPPPPAPAPAPRALTPLEEAYADLDARLEEARGRFGGVSYKLQDQLVTAWQERWRRKGLSVSRPGGAR